MTETRTRKRLPLGDGAVVLTPIYQSDNPSTAWRAEIVGRPTRSGVGPSIATAVGALVLANPGSFRIASQSDAVWANLGDQTIKEWPVSYETDLPAVGPSGLRFKYVRSTGLNDEPDRYEILDVDGVVVDTYRMIGQAGHHYNSGHPCRPSCCPDVGSNGRVNLRPGRPY